jgi:putative pyruvate formate lyase activating enzyme
MKKISLQTNKNLKNPLSNYLAVMTNLQLSQSKVASIIKAKHCEDDNSLYLQHESLRNDFKRVYKEISNNAQVGKLENDQINKFKSKSFFSYLDLKVKIAERMFKKCNFCETACGLDRRIGPGKCDVEETKIASEFLHVGEEPPLVPSHTIFFAGCNFNCVYCQNWDISQNPDRGITLNGENLALIIEKRRTEGSRNVNFVGGDPTPNLLFILRTMQRVRVNIPVVWNSNMYLSTDAMFLLDGLADLYLTDFKYGNNECALRLSGISNYMEVVGRNHKMAFQAGEMIIRHLVLPNHIECCSKPILKWVSENLGLEVVLNIMGQYHPVYQAHEHEEISRPPLTGEMGEVVQYAHDLGFKNLM